MNRNDRIENFNMKNNAAVSVLTRILEAKIRKQLKVDIANDFLKKHPKKN